jgi:hypothetical protein
VEHTFIKFLGVEWNATHISSLTFEQFLAENKGNQLKKHGETEEIKLREVFEACKKAQEEAEKAAKAEEEKKKTEAAAAQSAPVEEKKPNPKDEKKQTGAPVEEKKP